MKLLRLLDGHFKSDLNTIVIHVNESHANMIRLRFRFALALDGSLPIEFDLSNDVKYKQVIGLQFYTPLHLLLKCCIKRKIE